VAVVLGAVVGFGAALVGVVFIGGLLAPGRGSYEDLLPPVFVVSPFGAFAGAMLARRLVRPDYRT
jgi:type IV secretory pathway VirB2 component (pilin)